MFINVRIIIVLRNMGKVIFRLKRYWTYPDGKIVDLYNEIKEGRKTSEFRDCTEYWTDRLYKTKTINDLDHLTPKVDRAWFIVGYPKGNLPRLEADITNVLTHIDDEGFAEQYEIQFTNVKEVTE